MTYVPKSNALTKYAYEHNQANGAQPQASSNGTFHSILKSLGAAININGTAHSAHNASGYGAAVHNLLAATGTSMSVAHSGVDAGAGDNSTGKFMHKLGKGLSKMSVSMSVENKTHSG